MTTPPLSKTPETASELLRSRFDRLIIQQLVARKFARDYPEDSQKLLGLRNVIHAHIRDAGINPLAGETEAQTLATLMGIYESPSGQLAISEGNLDHITENYPLDQACGIRLQNGLRAVISDMAQHLGFVDRIRLAYNYFDYFSLIDLTAAFPGRPAFDFYAKTAAADLLKEIPATVAKDLKDEDIAGAFNPPPEANWFFTRKVPDDFDLEIALMRSSHLRTFHSPNITFHGCAKPEKSNGSKAGYSSLIIKVDLDKAPHNIDFAMNSLREYLLDGLLTRHGYATKIERFDEFIDSDFYKNTGPTSDLIRGWNQIQGFLIGIWCWDMVVKEKSNVINAMESILNAQAEIISETKGNNIDLNAIGDKAIGKHYQRVDRLIAPKKDDKLSYLVTGDRSISLGDRLNY